MTKLEKLAIDTLFIEYKHAAVFYRQGGDSEQERIAQEGLHCLRTLSQSLNHIINEEGAQ